MKEVKQNIVGDNNIQVAGDYINTPKHTTKIEVQYDPDKYISDKEAMLIRKKVAEIAGILTTDSKSSKSVYSKIYSALNEKFGCSKYTLIPKDNFEAAIDFLLKYKGIKFSKRNLTERQRTDRYKSIHAKASELKMSHDDMYRIINEFLSHKKYYTSIKDLSDASLNKVYFYFRKM